MAESHESVRKFIEKMRTVLDKKCGCSLMVELQPSKLTVRVRFSSPAPNSQLTSFGVFFYLSWIMISKGIREFSKLFDPFFYYKKGRLVRKIIFLMST